MLNESYFQMQETQIWRWVSSWTETTVALKTQTDQETKYIQNSTGDGRSWSENSKGKNDIKKEKNGIKIETERCTSVCSNWSIPPQSSTLRLAGFVGGQGTTRAGKAKPRNSSLSPPMLKITIHSWTPTFPGSYNSGTAYGYVESRYAVHRKIWVYTISYYIDVEMPIVSAAWNNCNLTSLLLTYYSHWIFRWKNRLLKFISAQDKIC